MPLNLCEAVLLSKHFVFGWHAVVDSVQNKQVLQYSTLRCKKQMSPLPVYQNSYLSKCRTPMLRTFLTVAKAYVSERLISQSCTIAKLLVVICENISVSDLVVVDILDNLRTSLLTDWHSLDPALNSLLRRQFQHSNHLRSIPDV